MRTRKRRGCAVSASGWEPPSGLPRDRWTRFSSASENEEGNNDDDDDDDEGPEDGAFLSSSSSSSSSASSSLRRKALRDRLRPTKRCSA